MVSVVPHAGTWIEITSLDALTVLLPVVPHAGTWIEIVIQYLILKSSNVVPHAGTWIEMPSKSGEILIKCRAPRGHVD